MRVIVSVTTIPSRIGNIERTLNSILNQNVKPDIISLNIPEVCRRRPKTGYEIPECVLKMPSVRIVRTPYDHGSSMKLLPVLELEKDPESIIITVDDDHEYNDGFIETLLEYEQRHPDCALGFNGWLVRPLIEENRYEFIEEYLEKPVRADVLEGYRGVLYKPRFFDRSIFDYNGFSEVAHRVDDVWISAHLAKRGVVRLVLPGVYSREFELPRGLHKALSFKRYNRVMAKEFDKKGYWK
jgi:hypothetical protein